VAIGSRVHTTGYSRFITIGGVGAAAHLTTSRRQRNWSKCSNQTGTADAGDINRHRNSRLAQITVGRGNHRSYPDYRHRIANGTSSTGLLTSPAAPSTTAGGRVNQYSQWRPGASTTNASPAIGASASTPVQWGMSPSEAAQRRLTTLLLQMETLIRPAHRAIRLAYCSRRYRHRHPQPNSGAPSP